MAAPRTGFPRSLRGLYDWLDANVPDENDYSSIQTELDGKVSIAALDDVDAIETPAEATAEDLATAFNALLSALKGE